MKQCELANLVLNNVNTIFYVVDLQSHELLFINQPAEKEKLNIFHGDFQSKQCYKFLYNCDKPCANCHNGELVKNKRVRKEIYDSVNRKYYTQLDTLIEVSGKPAKLSIIYDPMMANDDLKRISQKLTLEETLVSCIHTLIEDDHADTSIQTLLKIVADYYGAQHAYVYELNHTHYTVRKIHEYGSEDVIGFVIKNRAMPAYLFKPIINIFNRFGEFSLNSIEKDLDHRSLVYKFLKSCNVNSLLLVPFFDGGKVAYCIGVDVPTKNANDLRLLHSVILFIVDKLRKSQVHNQLVLLSYSDVLTGLWNRNKYNQRLEELSQAKYNTFGYIYIKINKLKEINALYGEQYGDELIKRASYLMEQSLSPNLFRLAGNDYISLHPNFTSDEFNCVLLSLKEDLKEHKDISLSIGRIYQHKKVDIRKGISQSYDMMFAERQKTYKSNSDGIVQSRQNPVQIILDEIRSGCFTVYLQPKVDLVTEEITSVEALVRKFDKNGKMIPPDHFIPIYEQEGTIRHIDFYVLEEVCKLLSRLLDKGIALKVAVNFSRVTFLSPSLLDEIVSICAMYKVPHEYIKIEITESIDKMDFEFYDKKLKKIKNAGFEISLDDFGAKHSNLLMLTMTEFSEVKIDKGLIDYITQSAQNRALVKNILKMITELGTSICVAEGIETKEQKDLILEFGCTYGQGYFFYRPMPVEEFLLTYEMSINKSHLPHTIKHDYKLNFNLSYNEMASIIDAMPFCLSILSTDKNIISCNQCLLETFGFTTKEEFLSQFFSLSPEYQPNGISSSELTKRYLDEASRTGYVNFPWVHRTKQGKEFSAEVTLKKLKVMGSEDTPLIAGFIREISPSIVNDYSIAWAENYGFNNDISDRKLISTLLDITNDWLWTYNYKNRQMMFFGQGYEQIGFSKEKFVFPETFLDRGLIYEDDLKDFMKACENLAKGEHSPIEVRLNIPGGSVRFFRIIYKIVKNSEGIPLSAIGKVIDIDSQKRLSLFPQVDEFIGCYNNFTTKMLINESIQLNPNNLHVLFVIKVNEFKVENDVPESFFDDLLVNISQALLTNFREGDIVGLDDDKNFVVFLKNPPHLEIVTDKMQLIETILAQSYVNLDSACIIRDFIGIALYTKDGYDFEQLHRNALVKTINTLSIN